MSAPTVDRPATDRASRRHRAGSAAASSDGQRSIAEWQAEAVRQRQLMAEASARGENPDDSGYMRALDGLGGQPQDAADARALLEHLRYMAGDDGIVANEFIHSVIDRVLPFVGQPTKPDTDTPVMAAARLMNAACETHRDADEAKRPDQLEVMDATGDAVDACKVLVSTLPSRCILDVAIQVMLAAAEAHWLGAYTSEELAQANHLRIRRHLNSALAALVAHAGVDLRPFAGEHFLTKAQLDGR